MAQLPQSSYVNIPGVRVGSSLEFSAADDVLFATKRVNQPADASNLYYLVRSTLYQGPMKHLPDGQVP